MSPQRTSRAAFSLIEVTLALGIAAFCLLTVFGLLPIGLSSTQNAAEQTAVSGIVTAISADLHGTPILSSTGATTSQFSIKIPSVSESGDATNSNSGTLNSTYQTTLFFTQDGAPIGTPNTNATTAGGVPRYRATITITADQTLAPLATGPFTLYKAWIFITWPALADPMANKFPTNFSGSYEIVTALNLRHS